MIETVLDEEKRGTRRKEGRGGRRDGEEGSVVQSTGSSTLTLKDPLTDPHN